MKRFYIGHPGLVPLITISFIVFTYVSGFSINRNANVLRRAYDSVPAVVEPASVTIDPVGHCRHEEQFQSPAVPPAQYGADDVRNQDQAKYGEKVGEVEPARHLYSSVTRSFAGTASRENRGRGPCLWGRTYCPAHYRGQD